MPPPAKFDWESAPLAEAERRLADLKGIYEHAATVMDRRRSVVPQRYTCWTQDHLEDKFEDGTSVISVATKLQCRKEGPEGRENFRDDGARDPHGNRITIRICSYLCYQDYNRFRIQQKQRGAGVLGVPVLPVKAQ